ncbi:interferon-induced GTP-binding protein Mx2 [Pseudomassariella vexata]|uniref:Interferon-induced GTP-binding protein Mx2 n=1 Tax=Pseudomassariella vexata TaxID=1141098 RepID=A0A1Y2E111_9PEZI|nr:interferon-induced GTP-binding protein Mx2 [Pseudomassariella vexata]ORY65220.1 interferon-induced GTP-binding protein Mx2 [Pseudomassariella vexata]
MSQLVVVGDQSSGKSSVLEGITGFAFPRDAGLCTRYATQITCRREDQQSVIVSIIPHEDSDPDERVMIKEFHKTLDELTDASLANIFKQANETMGLRSSEDDEQTDGSARPTFSEHILKIEICGPNHFTVIDVPGIFRNTEGKDYILSHHYRDIELVRDMVKKYMKDPRTIILAIMPCNVDPATQEVLKLAKQFDPQMTRTMGVLTKPDLAIERAIQQIAINHVLGKRGDLTLGYYIVKNRGPDDVTMSLAEGQMKEKNFFSEDPWSTLRNTERAGIFALKLKVRELLIDLIKQEFPKLRAEVTKELVDLKTQLNKMGPSRSDPLSQRAYLSNMCENFQSITRDALSANYTGNNIFSDSDSLRLITRVVEANEAFSNQISWAGHTRSFTDSGKLHQEESESEEDPFGPQKTRSFSFASRQSLESEDLAEAVQFPELDSILQESSARRHIKHDDDIMEYIELVYNNSRGADLGTFSGSMLAAIFKEQTKNWESITLYHVSRSIILVHQFIVKVIEEVCPDAHVFDTLWNDHILEKLQQTYIRAIDKAKYLLSIEREHLPFTLNHYFNDNLQKLQGERLVSLMKNLGISDDTGAHLTWPQVGNLSANKGNPEHVREYIHDVLYSYYKVALKRFVDVVCQQAVFYYLLRGQESPLQIFKYELVNEFSDEELENIAGESASVKAQRAKLDRDIKDFEEAMRVLRGSK